MTANAPIKQQLLVAIPTDPPPGRATSEGRLPRVVSAIWLAGASLVLVLACIMTLGSQRQVLLPMLGPLPETCTMHARFGIDCPGCGLTRSFISLAHGDLRAAWKLNPVSLLIFMYVVVQLPLATAHLLLAKISGLKRWTQWNQTAFIALLIALFLQWIWRLLTGALS